MHGHFTGVETHRHFTANQHLQGITFQNSALFHSQRSHFREIGSKRQLGVHIPLLFGDGLVLQQCAVNRHTVDRLPSKIGNNNAFILTAKRIVCRRGIGHQYRSLTGGR